MRIFFGSALLLPARSGCVSSKRFFILILISNLFKNEFTQDWLKDELYVLLHTNVRKKIMQENRNRRHLANMIDDICENFNNNINNLILSKIKDAVCAVY